MEECKYRVKKKTQMSRLINTELKSDSEPSELDSDLEVESKSDAKLMVKLEKSDSDFEWDTKS